jgi:hypothetical protein
MSTGLQAAANWTVDQLYSLMNKFADQANAEHARLTTNTHRIAELAAKVRLISDPVVRAKAQESVNAVSKQQAQAILDYKSFTTQWQSIVTKVTSWLRSVGVNPPEFRLNGLGAVPFVPIAIAVAAVAVGVFLASLAAKNSAISKALNDTDVCRNAWLDGKITQGQYDKCVQDIKAALAAGAAAGRQPFEASLEALIPIGLIVLAILVAPRVLDMFGKGAPVKGWR